MTQAKAKPDPMRPESDLSPDAHDIEAIRARGQQMLEREQRSAELAKVVNLATNQELVGLHDALTIWIQARFDLDARLRRILERAEGLP